VQVSVKEQSDGEFTVVFDGENGEPWFRSTEGYTRRFDAQRSLNDFLTQLAYPAQITVRHLDSGGEEIDYLHSDDGV
jgi:uncharacterized protein YegP (UPF0339 family)